MRRTPASVCSLAALLLALGACHSPMPSRGLDRPGASLDLHSHARPHQVRVKHVDLDLALDFVAEQIAGTAVLSFEVAPGCAGEPLVLDTADLEIDAVTGADGQPRAFELGAAHPILGVPLTIWRAPGDRQVAVRYRTRRGAAALQWLGAEQTAGSMPFLYTQGQAILTRTWIPLQDSPGVRITFDARVSAPQGLVAVMAAEQRGRDADGAYRFRMRQPIPPYLLALACGDLEFRPLSVRCGVWAEPATVDAAAAEFADVPAMLRACEGLFGPYRWERYDVLVLPPAFPFGGMENPRLTFATPTILAGDRSLVALIAHELAHSWSGNLVTNATWRDFWLNEGFTVYLEQRVMAAVFGPERAQMEILIGMQGLDDELAELAPGDQVLHIDLAGRNPDDGMTAVPYDKGAAFLRALELRFGRTVFDAFLQQYFEAHAFQSITTDVFLADLREHLLERHPEQAQGFDVEAWVYGPGLPADAPRPASAAFARVETAAAGFALGAVVPGDLGAAEWTTSEWLHFLRALPAELPSEQLARLDAAFALTSSGNAEILAAWLGLCIRHDYRPADAAIEAFLLGVGRRKFLTPLYKALMEHDPARAQAIYAQARGRYHAVSTRTLDEIVGRP